MSELDGVPFMAIGNGELKGRPIVNIGDFIVCPKCEKNHKLGAATTKDGAISDMLYFYKCGKNNYLAALKKQLIPNLELA